METFFGKEDYDALGDFILHVINWKNEVQKSMVKNIPQWGPQFFSLAVIISSSENFLKIIKTRYQKCYQKYLFLLLSSKLVKFSEFQLQKAQLFLRSSLNTFVIWE